MAGCEGPVQELALDGSHNVCGIKGMSRALNLYTVCPLGCTPCAHWVPLSKPLSLLPCGNVSLLDLDCGLLW